MIDFERVLLPVDRRVVVEFFRVFMFLFVLPNVSDETNNTQFFTTIMKDHASCLARTEARHELVVRDFEPGRNATFSGPLMLPAATPIMRWPTYNTNALQKLFAAAEPGEIMPLALKNREENSMCWSKSSQNLT